MGENAAELLLAIEMVYHQWLGGDLPQEDALFAIGDLLAKVKDSGILPGPS
jgi:hypothetical protein